MEHQFAGVFGLRIPPCSAGAIHVPKRLSPPGNTRPAPARYHDVDFSRRHHTNPILGLVIRRNAPHWKLVNTPSIPTRCLFPPACVIISSIGPALRDSATCPNSSTSPARRRCFSFASLSAVLPTRSLPAQRPPQRRRGATREAAPHSTRPARACPRADFPPSAADPVTCSERGRRLRSPPFPPPPPKRVSSVVSRHLVRKLSLVSNRRSGPAQHDSTIRPRYARVRPHCRLDKPTC